MKLAETIAQKATAAFQERADAEILGDWSDIRDQERFIACLRGGTAGVEGPRSVIASMHTGGLGVWGSSAASALDKASEDYEETFETGMIEEIAPGRYRLTW